MLVLACKGLKTLVGQTIMSPSTMHTLDLTANQLDDGQELAKFPKLVHLIVDNNRFSTLDDFPSFPSLETFSANKNKFEELDMFLEQAKKKFPNLKNLSLVNNPLSPYFEGGTKYEKFKETILNAFPKLETLDGAYLNKQGMKLNIEPNKIAGSKKKDSGAEEESLQRFKKQDKGYKIKDLKENEEEDEKEDYEEVDERRLLTVIEYNEKFLKKPMRNLNLNSQGNKFVQNNQL